jgi:hypothetical protein
MTGSERGKFKPESFKGSAIIAAVALLSAVFLDRYHPLEPTWGRFLDGVILAALVIFVLQVRARAKRSVRSYLYCLAGSVVLFRVLCWDAIFANPGSYNPKIALALWAGMTVIGLGGLLGFERADSETPK